MQSLVTVLHVLLRKNLRFYITILRFAAKPIEISFQAFCKLDSSLFLVELCLIAAYNHTTRVMVGFQDKFIRQGIKIDLFIAVPNSKSRNNKLLS